MNTNSKSRRERAKQVVGSALALASAEARLEESEARLANSKKRVFQINVLAIYGSVAFFLMFAFSGALENLLTFTSFCVVIACNRDAVEARFKRKYPDIPIH